MGHEPAAPLDPPPGAQLFLPSLCLGELCPWAPELKLLWGDLPDWGAAGPIKSPAGETLAGHCQVPGRNFRTFSACLVTAASGDFEVQ